MAKKRARVRVDESDSKEPTQYYFTSTEKNVPLLHSGCNMLDQVLGGGWAGGRILNLVGDKSTAKTALATEMVINFLKDFPDGKAAYRDAEEAFDEDYAAEMGMPVDQVDFGDPDNPIETIEAFYSDLDSFTDSCKKSNVPGLYVMDSLDALSDEAEMERAITKGSYGGDKQKKLNEMFRKLKGKCRRANVTLLIVSQVRENIGVTFGEKYRRNGGKGLDHYCSQILWLAHVGLLKRTVNKITRPYGIQIKAKCKKNKVGLPFRECDMQFIFGYGIDDLEATLSFLKSVNKLGEVDVPKDIGAFMKKLHEEGDVKTYRKLLKKANAVANRIWQEAEISFIPKARKY